jgi:hypothetical protein
MQAWLNKLTITQVSMLGETVLSNFAPNIINELDKKAITLTVVYTLIFLLNSCAWMCLVRNVPLRLRWEVVKCIQYNYVQGPRYGTVFCPKKNKGEKLLFVGFSKYHKLWGATNFCQWGECWYVGDNSHSNIFSCFKNLIICFSRKIPLWINYNMCEK